MIYSAALSLHFTLMWKSSLQMTDSRAHEPEPG